VRNRAGESQTRSRRRGRLLACDSPSMERVAVLPQGDSSAVRPICAARRDSLVGSRSRISSSESVATVKAMLKVTAADYDQALDRAEADLTELAKRLDRSVPDETFATAALSLGGRTPLARLVRIRLRPQGCSAVCTGAGSARSMQWRHPQARSGRRALALDGGGE
jgi:hypothetical protein